jgi:hypothetical protein
MRSGAGLFASLRAVGSLGIVLLFGAGCVTSTAHMLPVAGNSLPQQAEACELACHSLLVPPPASPNCGSMVAPGTSCEPPPPDRSAYARCLDGCPGARAVDGSSCPDPPRTGLVCAETHRRNTVGIIGGAVALGAAVLLVVLVSILSMPIGV